MLVGIMGKMGSGKTLTMSILASYLSRATKAPLRANYKLEGALPVESMNDVVEAESAIFCFDEMWLSMDSRMWQDNIRLTQWVNQTRKKRMIVFYTTQHIRQIELRARNATDILIVAEKKPEGIWLTFIDYQWKSIGKRFLINKPERFYNIYNTYEVLKPLEWTKKKESGYSNNSYSHVSKHSYRR